MFLYLYGISYSRFFRIKEYYKVYGIFLRIYGNVSRVFSNSIFYFLVVDVYVFFENYVEENVIMLFGRIFGYKSDDVKILFFFEIKMSVWKVYSFICEVLNK